MVVITVVVIAVIVIAGSTTGIQGGHTGGEFLETPPESRARTRSTMAWISAGVGRDENLGIVP